MPEQHKQMDTGAQVQDSLFGPAPATGLTLTLPVLELSPRQRTILNVLRWQNGHRRAIPLKQLAARVGASPRLIQKDVYSLIVEAHANIGSTDCKGHAGYFVMVSLEDEAINNKFCASHIYPQLRRLHTQAKDCKARAALGAALELIESELQEQKETPHNDKV